MNYEIVSREACSIIGLPLVTSNEPGRADKEIGPHWARFYQENVLSEIPGRLGEGLVGLYTDYEGDHTQPYTLVIGAMVDPAIEEAPAGLTLKRIPATSYALVPVVGDFPDSLISAWQKVWNSTLPRAYSYDLEVYPEGFPEQLDTLVKLYIALGEDVS